MSDERRLELTRRSVLGSAAIGVGGLALAGCGTGGDAGSSTTGEASPASGRTPKRGGTFRMGMSDSSPSDSLDPNDGNNTHTNVALCRNLYDRLTAADLASTKIVNSLAEELTPAPDLKSWDVRVKDAQWHDGKPVTADDVIYTLKRILDPKAPGGGAPGLSAVDTKRLKKLDDKTVRIHLHFPDVNIPHALSGGHGGSASIVPVGFDPKKPVGSGPFKFVSSEPGKRTVMERNDDYWESGQPYLDRLEFIGFADAGTPRINALSGGQIDGADQLDVTLVPTIESNPALTLLISKSSAFNVWEMRQDVAPFDDVRVRQAMRLLADRKQIVEQALGGSRFASVANDLPSVQDPLYNRSLPQREQDIEQAKFLLKQAGREDLTTTLTLSNLTAGALQTAQVLQENAKAAGVNLKIENIRDATQYFAKHYFQAPFKFNYYGTFQLLSYAFLSLVPKAPYNISNYDDPKFTRLMMQARRTADADKQKQLAAAAQEILWNSGTQGIFSFTRTAEAHSKKFAGFKPDLWGFSLNQLRFADVHMV